MRKPCPRPAFPGLGLRFCTAPGGLRLGLHARQKCDAREGKGWERPYLVKEPVGCVTVQGYNTVVQFLASLPNVIEQRDGQRETPLAIAIRRGNLEMQVWTAGRFLLHHSGRVLEQLHCFFHHLHLHVQAFSETCFIALAGHHPLLHR